MQAEALQNQDIAQEAADFLLQEEIAREAEAYLREHSNLRDDTETWCAEVLDGSMRTEFTFNFDGEELYDQGEPPRSIGEIFRNATADAETLAMSHPELAFELRRREIEGDGEYQDMLKMMRGELPNTMIVVSDAPAELHNFSKNVGGYNITRRQTMQRTIIRNMDNTITIRTQSLDRSDREGLEDIYHSLGEEPQAGELLGQRIYKNLNKDEQDGLQDQIRQVYDDRLRTKLGGEWYAGRNPAEMVNTFEFVRKQSDLIEAFIHASQQPDLNKSQIDRLHYNLAAAMEARWEGTSIKTANGDPNMEMYYAGQEAEAGNKSFSGCGMTIDMEAAGYGNKTQEVHCPFCRKKQIADPCSPNQKCVNKDCEAEVIDGKVVFEGHGTATKAKTFGKFLIETLKPESDN